MSRVTALLPTVLADVLVSVPDSTAKPDVCLISFDSHYICSDNEGKGTNTPSFMLIASIITLALSDS